MTGAARAASLRPVPTRPCASPRTPALPSAFRLLILGGTAQASLLARALSGRRDLAPVLSLAGRTETPVVPPLPFRVGGFGGAHGLAGYLRDQEVAAVVDATHPFAARISASAQEACAALALPLATYTRPPWRAGPADRWIGVRDLAGAARALGSAPRRALLTTGRLGLAAFREAPQHDYVIRTIDPPDPADLPPRSRVVLGRGPFPVEAETALMRREGIKVLVTKNSGGGAVAGKLEAARRLGVPVVMVQPPDPPQGTVFTELARLLDWIAALQRAAP